MPAETRKRRQAPTLKNASQRKNAPKKKTVATIEQLAAQYHVLKPLADAFLIEIKHQLEHLLKEEKVALSFPCEARVKDLASITEKIERVSLQLEDIEDLQDLIGLRLVIQFRRDVAKVTDVIERNFRIQKKYNTADRLNDDQFGYASLHFILQIKPDWLQVPTLSRFTGLTAELQVRTTAQHIWASASHTLQYKREESVPPTVKRAIYRVSALLETVDLEFERVLEERDAYRENAPIETDNTLNVDLLEKVLDSLWPPANKKHGREPYEDLLQDLHKFNVMTVDKLKQVIEKNHSSTLNVDRQEALRRDPEDPDEDAERLSRGIFYTHIGLTRQAMTHEFGEEWTQYIMNKSKKKPT